MVEELSEIVPTFPGEANRTRCFAHIVNLIAKSVIKQFDVPKQRAGDTSGGSVDKLIALAGDIELEERATRGYAYDNDSEIEDDNVENWTDELLGMSREEHEKLDGEIQPVRRVLVKVSSFDHWTLSLLTRWWARAVLSSSANLPTLSKTRQPSSYQDGTTLSKDTSSESASCLGMSLPGGTLRTTCLCSRFSIGQLWTTSLAIVI